jgi:DinB family protein
MKVLEFGAGARTGVVLALLVGSLAVGASPASAQEMTKESAAAVKAAFIADVDVMRGKFIGLAQAFPADKYTWRPMEGVRSVSEVLMLIASEGYGFVPSAVGGKPGLAREEMGGLSKITDKQQVIDHLTKAFAHAKQELEAADPATLVAKRRVMGQDRTLPDIVMAVGGDMHEHLGQLIAYARTNHVVPPWSK